MSHHRGTGVSSHWGRRQAREVGNKPKWGKHQDCALGGGVDFTGIMKKLHLPESESGTPKPIQNEWVLKLMVSDKCAPSNEDGNARKKQEET